MSRLRQNGSPDEESDEEAAGVSHEDSSWIEIEDEKTSLRSAQDGKEDRVLNISLRNVEIDQIHGRDQADSRRQAVHIVQQIESVRNSHDPNDGKKHANHRVRVEGLYDPSNYSQGRCADLGQQLGAWRHAPDVIGQPKEAYHRSNGN
jgi:hypothetical protein